MNTTTLANVNVTNKARLPDYYNSALSFYTKLLAVAVTGLILMGALVKSHDAGLSVPDWPTTFGQNMFLYPPSEWTGGVFYEHTHRLVASVVGVLTVILFVWLLRVETRNWVKILGGCAVLAVITQGVLGGLTVLLKLPPIVSIAHGVLAQTYFIIILVLAYSESKEFLTWKKPSPINSPFVSSAIIVTTLIYLQLILGALMRHTGSGLAVPDFPTMGGSIFPTLNDQFVSVINDIRLQMGLRPVNLGQITINLFHRLGAVIVTTAAIMLALKLKRNRAQILRNTSRRLLIIILLQWTLGMYAIWTVRDPFVTSFHVVIGAILLGFSTLLSLRCWRFQNE